MVARLLVPMATSALAEVHRAPFGPGLRPGPCRQALDAGGAAPHNARRSGSGLCDLSHGIWHLWRENDGPAYSRGRGAPGLRCCGTCLPAGAGLLTQRRRRARRAPARKGAAGRPPGVSAVPATPPPRWQLFPRQLAQPVVALALPRLNSARAGRPGAPKACP
jgi:hypothetical protein